MGKYPLKVILAASVALTTLTVGETEASALPVTNSGVAIAADAMTNVEQARWVCGPYRCWWRPNYYYGWRRPYWRRRYWGWRRWRRW